MDRTHEDRIARALAHMSERGLAQTIVTSGAAIRYLTGVSIDPGERMLALYLSAGGERRMFVNALFPQGGDAGLPVTWHADGEDAVEILSRAVDASSPVGIDGACPARFLLRLQELLPGARCVEASWAVDAARRIKDEDERERMREAGRRIDRVMERLVPMTAAGMSERELAAACLSLIEEEGGEGPAFAPITAYDGGAADPHHAPGDARGGEGSCALLDIGLMWGGYASDMTRTVFVGHVSDRQRQIYEIVREAQARGIEAARPGARMCDVDAACRSHIAAHGFGPHFTHRTGHSIGMETHEAGDVSAANEAIIKEGQAFSIEPGIYLPEEGIGVRIEDVVLIGPDGAEPLTRYPKDLTVVPRA